jgi:hypothetical protein
MSFNCVLISPFRPRPAVTRYHHAHMLGGPPRTFLAGFRGGIAARSRPRSIQQAFSRREEALRDLSVLKGVVRKAGFRRRPGPHSSACTALHLASARLMRCAPVTPGSAHSCPRSSHTAVRASVRACLHPYGFVHARNSCAAHTALPVACCCGPVATCTRDVTEDSGEHSVVSNPRLSLPMCGILYDS